MSKLQSETDSTKDFSDEQPEHQSKRTFFIELTVSIVYTLLKIALIAVVIGFAGSLSLRQFQASNSYLRTQENIWLWQQEIIVDFRVVQAANCPQGWEHYTNYSWSGNMEGCSCSFKVGLFEYTAVLQGRCSHREFEKGCLSVPANPQIPFLFWKDKAHLCVKRLHNYNFYSSEANIINPNGHNISNCSMGKNYQIDLIEPIPCPITSMANDYSLNETIPELGFTFSRQDNYPLVHIRISQFAFCEALYQNNKSPGRTSNYILENNYQYECQSTDSRTIFLDSQGEADLFQNNAKIEYVISTLPAYPQLTNDYNYSLGFVRYPAWKYFCRNSNSYNLKVATSFLTFEQIEPTVLRFQALVLVGSLLNFVFVGYYWVSCYLYLKTKYMHGYLYLKDYEIRKINPHTNIVKNRTTEIAKYLAFEISPLLTIIFLIVLYFQLKSAKAWFSDASACTEGSFLSYLKGYQQFAGGEMVVTLSSIFVNLALICMDICYLLWRYFKGDLEEAQEDADSFSKGSEKMTNLSDYNIKQLNITEEFLVDNTFAVEKVEKINIYTFDDDAEDEGRISEYSISSKAD